MRFAAFFFLCLLPVLARADMLACTSMWCQEGLTVDLKGNSWLQGQYTFVVTANDRTVTCKGALPFKDCEGAVTCDGEGVQIGESGCALPPEQHSFHAVMVATPPQKIVIDIQRGDGRAFSFSSPVEQECSYPNGQECDIRECCSAVLSADVVWR